MNKSTIKTLLKGTIVLVLFSLLLEINLANLENYAIFVLIWYVILFLYVYSKESIRFEIGKESLVLKGFMGTKTILFGEIDLVFFKSGFLQKLFNLGSVYIISKRTSIVIRDKLDYEQLTQKINEIRHSKKNLEYKK